MEARERAIDAETGMIVGSTGGYASRRRPPSVALEGDIMMGFVGEKSKPMPSRQAPAASGTVVGAAPPRSVEDFRQHLLKQVSDAARARMQVSGSVDAGSASALRNLWEKSDLPASKLAEEAARFWKLRCLNLQDLMNATGAVEHFSTRFLRESSVFPFRMEQGRFGVAVSDPTDSAAIRAVEIVCGGAVEVVVASFDDISTVLERQIDEPSANAVDVDEPKHRSGDDDIESLRDLASGAPVVRAVNDLLERAVELRASDIHIEPFRTGMVVRMRVDGMLRTVPAPANAPPQAVVSRIKILASLNIAERRLPQDGAARARVGRSEIDIRIATMPTQQGESAVIRLLPRDRGLLELSKVGLASRDESSLRRLLALPHGLIVITGPTGSGKTTTLATMLGILNEPTRKILTIEDPVEYEIPGINQSQVKPAIGLTFATAMRAFVRQDPDVIMVGEIRDAETANIAIHAALTGHLVLTTLHTETAAAAVPRLLDLGVEGFLLQSTLRAVIAQRLVRVLCDSCKRMHALNGGDLAADPRYRVLGFSAGETVYQPEGCERCSGTGYRGRAGVFELLEMTEEVRPFVCAHADSFAIDKAAISAGMTTMIDDGVAKCRAGITAVSEVLRVTSVR
jgi:general secretion pathway protein E